VKTLLDFNFLAILNLLVLLLWPTSGAIYVGTNPPGDPPRRIAPLSIIMVILTAIAILIDVIFLAVRIVQV